VYNSSNQTCRVSQVVSSFSNFATVQVAPNSAEMPPQIAVSFNPISINVNETSTLTITFTNPAANTLALTGVGVTDNFPDGMEVDAVPTATNSCPTGSTFNPTAGATNVSISGVTVPINSTCTFSVKVKGTTAGVKLNPTGNVISSNGGNGGTASATLTVNGAAARSFEADVAPRPDGNGNGLVNAGDVTQVMRFSVGLDKPFQSNEFQRADAAPRLAPDNVTPLLGNGIVNAGDVTQALRYSVGLDGGTVAAGGPTAPAAVPAPGEESNVFINDGIQTDDNSELMTAGYTVFATRQSLVGNTLTVAIVLNSDASKTGVNSVAGTLRFTPSVISNPTNIRLGSGAPANSIFFPNTTDTANGRLGFNFIAPVNQTVAAGSQTLLLIDFTVAAGAPSSTTLSFDDSQSQRFVGDVFGNELTPANFPTNTIVLTPTAGQVSIEGRVLDNTGRGLAGAQVSLTDQNGDVRYGRTNQLGYYQMSGLRSGGTYVIDVTHKRYLYNPQVISINTSVSGVNFTALEAVKTDEP
jgi:hypothetical protein